MSRADDGEAVLQVGLVGLVDRLTDSVPEVHAAQLAAAAAAGPEVDEELVAVAADVGAVAAAAATRSGLASGLLVPGSHGGVRFAHDLVRTTLADRLDPARARAVHRRLAAHFGTRTAVTPVRVAAHWSAGAEDAEGHREASRWWGIAADDAARLMAYEDAAGHLRAMREELERAEATAAERSVACIRLAQAEHRAGRYAEAIRAVERASALAEDADRVDLLAQAALVLGWLTYPEANELVTRLSHAAMRHEARLDVATRSRLLASVAALATTDGTERDEAAGEAMALARRSGDPQALLDAARAGETTLPEQGIGERLLSLGDLAVAQASVLGQPMGVVVAQTWRIRAALELGRTALADDALTRLVATADSSRVPLGQWHALRAKVSLAALRGEFARVPELNARASAIAARSGDPVAVGMSYASAHHVALRRGVPPADTEFRLELLAAAPHTPLIEVVRALLLLGAGRRDEAELVYRRVTPLLGRAHGIRPWTPVVAYLVTLAEAFEDHATASALVVELAPWSGFAGAVGITTAYFTGPPCHELGQALALAGRLDDAVTELESAVVHNEHLGALPDLALSRIDLAAALLGTAESRGDAASVRRRALDLARVAALECRRLDMPGQLARAAALVSRATAAMERADPLSSREREVADLVVTGLTNRDIAVRLVLSERTVESHVRSVLMKLGYRNRADLIRQRTRSGTTGPP